MTISRDQPAEGTVPRTISSKGFFSDFFESMAKAGRRFQKISFSQRVLVAIASIAATIFTIVGGVFVFRSLANFFAEKKVTSLSSSEVGESSSPALNSASKAEKIFNEKLGSSKRKKQKGKEVEGKELSLDDSLSFVKSYCEDVTKSISRIEKEILRFRKIALDLMHRAPNKMTATNLSKIESYIDKFQKCLKSFEGKIHLGELMIAGQKENASPSGLSPFEKLRERLAAKNELLDKLQKSVQIIKENNLTDMKLEEEAASATDAIFQAFKEIDGELTKISYQSEKPNQLIASLENKLESIRPLFDKVRDFELREVLINWFISLDGKFTEKKALISNYLLQLQLDFEKFKKEDAESEEKNTISIKRDKIGCLNFLTSEELEEALLLKRQIMARIAFFNSLASYVQEHLNNDIEIKLVFDSFKGDHELLLLTLNEKVSEYKDRLNLLLEKKSLEALGIENKSDALAQAKQLVVLFRRFEKEFLAEEKECFSFEKFDLFREAISLLEKENLQVFHGIENVGNSCYLNSAIQVLLQIPFFKSALLQENWQTDFLNILEGDLNAFSKQLRDTLTPSLLNLENLKAVVEEWGESSSSLFDDNTLFEVTLSRFTESPLNENEIKILEELFQKVASEKKIEQAVKEFISLYDTPNYDSGDLKKASLKMRDAFFDAGVFFLSQNRTGMEDAVQILEKLLFNLNYQVNLVKMKFEKGKDVPLGHKETQPFQVIQIELPRENVDEIPSLQEVLDQAFSRSSHHDADPIRIESSLDSTVFEANDWDEKQSIENPPPYLVLQMKRYLKIEDDGNVEFEKIDTSFKLPTDYTFDLSKGFDLEKGSVQYRLKALVHHDDWGTKRADTGHYTALVEKDGSWSHADDSRVTEVIDPDRRMGRGYLYILEKV